MTEKGSNEVVGEAKERKGDCGKSGKTGTTSTKPGGTPGLSRRSMAVIFGGELCNVEVRICLRLPILYKTEVQDVGRQVHVVGGCECSDGAAERVGLKAARDLWQITRRYRRQNPPKMAVKSP